MAAGELCLDEYDFSFFMVFADFTECHADWFGT